MKNILTSLILICLSALVYGQQTVTYMQYNLLNYGNFTSYCTSSNNNPDAKDGYLHTILNYLQPDILAVNEMGSTSSNATHLLEEVLNNNSYGVTYKRADVTNNASSYIINMIFYNSDKLNLESQQVAQSVVRDINIYRLYMLNEDLAKGDTTFFNCAVAHLKAGSDNDDERDRGTMTQNLMNYLEYTELSEPLLFSGDMNFYSDSEEGLDNLINNPDPWLKFYDPLNRIGDWHNNSFYADVHSQSTHSANTGCASSGGLDDRFDFIFINKRIADNTNGVGYVANSYRTVGNDGNHFNKGILDTPTNTTVPADVLQALYYNSDHLPLTMELEISDASSIPESNPVYPALKVVNPANNIIEGSIYSRDILECTLSLLNANGQILATEKLGLIPGDNAFDIDASLLSSGLYLLRLVCDNGKLETRKIIVK